MDKSGKCPECNCSWDNGDIFEKLQSIRNSGTAYVGKTDEELLKFAAAYGWTPENPTRFSRLIGVEVRGGYDGVSKWRCPECSAEWDRFSGRKV
jgi:hypothetical protein